MHREKFPEKIPFRLTRMLVKAMEVSGIEGNFRTTCEHVMRVLRDNKESLMAVLEAFVYDPLINWRLLNTQPQSPAQSKCCFPDLRESLFTDSYFYTDERMRGFENMAHEDGPEDGHRNFSVSRRLNRIEVEAVANGKYLIHKQ